MLDLAAVTLMLGYGQTFVPECSLADCLWFPLDQLYSNKTRKTHVQETEISFTFEIKCRYRSLNRQHICSILSDIEQQMTTNPHRIKENISGPAVLRREVIE